MPYAHSGEIDIYYETHGESGPPIVFAHGAGGNATSWWQQVPAFASTHRVAVFDHRGFARSACAADMQSAALFERDLVAVMDAADFEQAVIVCQSMGGWTGVRAAVFAKKRVAGVLLANTPGAVRTPVTETNMKELARRLSAAGGLVNRAFSAEFAERNPAGALLYRQNLLLQHPGAAESARRRRVRLAGRGSRHRRAVPGSRERPGPALSAPCAGVRRRGHRGDAGADRRRRTLHLLREAGRVQRRTRRLPEHPRLALTGSYSVTSTPTGQWSEPSTCGQMKASYTRRCAEGEAST